MRFDLVDLQLFIAVAEARSITGGAERAHLALASASARIKGLEASVTWRPERWISSASCTPVAAAPTTSTPRRSNWLGLRYDEGVS